MAIIGPWQVGKTTLAQVISENYNSIYLDLESKADRAKLSDAGYYFRQHSDKLIIFDEIHKAPKIFQEMRGVIDKTRRNGRRNAQFLILGSAAIELLQKSGESLAGRIVCCEMYPLNMNEAGQENRETLWYRGG